MVADRGVYANMFTSWSYYMPGHTITIESYPDSAYAEFFMTSSASRTDPFFKLTAQPGDYTRMTFRGLSIIGYNAGAIWFVGSWPETLAGWNGGNTITNCVFSDVGNRFMPEQVGCFGVLDFVNSRDNLVENCLFIRCANVQPLDPLPGGNTTATWDTTVVNDADGSLPINGIYLAHGSTSTIVSGNKFQAMRGDCIRVRDASNNTLIQNNEAYRSPVTGFCTAWHCVNRPDLPMTCYALEDKSDGTTLEGNIIIGNWACGTPRLYYDLTREWGIPLGSVIYGVNSVTTCADHVDFQSKDPRDPVKD